MSQLFLLLLDSMRFDDIRNKNQCSHSCILNGEADSFKSTNQRSSSTQQTLMVTFIPSFPPRGHSALKLICFRDNEADLNELFYI